MSDKHVCNHSGHDINVIRGCENGRKTYLGEKMKRMVRKFNVKFAAILHLQCTLLALTLAGTGHFASSHGTRGGGGTTSLAVSPLIELELRGKNKRVARRKTKRLIYKLKVIGQPVTSEVRSSAEK